MFTVLTVAVLQITASLSFADGTHGNWKPKALTPAQQAAVNQCYTNAKVSPPAPNSKPDLSSLDQAGKKSLFQCVHKAEHTPST